MKKAEFLIVLDTEFVSMKKGGQPFQISMSAFHLNNDTLIKISDFNVYITLRKGVYLNKYVKAYTGVTEEKLHDEGIYPFMATNQLLDYVLNFDLKTTVLVGWDPSNDIRMMNLLVNHEDEIFDFKKATWLNLAASYSRLNGIPRGISRSLTEACNNYGMVDYDAHDAVEDCKATVELLRRMIEKHGVEEVIYKTINEEPKPKTKTKFKKVRE